jgi:subtilisin family serine protease
MDVLDQIGLTSLMKRSKGHSSISIGVIDGPVDFTHPSFVGTKIKTVNNYQLVQCKRANSYACIHGTFIVGILSGKRGLSSPAICPNCEIILRPIFTEKVNKDTNPPVPSCTAAELADAIIETVNAGAKIINLSVGLDSSSLHNLFEIKDAYDYAFQKGVVIIAAAGNHGNIGYSSLLNNQMIIPIVASDGTGRPSPISNTSPSISRRGLMAPGSITSTSSGGGYLKLHGTSVATPLISGMSALLWSIFQKATAAQIIHALRGLTNLRRRSIYPPLANAEESFNILNQIYNYSINNQFNSN